MTDGLIRSIPELVAGIRAARDEREITHETIDAISGLQSGYTSKVLAPEPMKTPGPVSLFPLLGAVGKALTIVDDPEQIKRVSGRWQKRKRPSKVMLLQAGFSIEEYRQKMREYMRECGRRGGQIGGKRRLVTMTKRERRRIAKQAAEARWAKARSAAEPGPTP